MFRGTVVSIHVKAKGGAPMVALESVRAVPGRGLEGDRNFGKPDLEPKREVTLVEAEAIEALRTDYGVELSPGETRRNVTTRGVPLNHLVGREFRVGEVRMRGVKLCEPCDHLQKLTGKPKILDGLVHRGGLRAQVLSEGTIRAGDAVEDA